MEGLTIQISLLPFQWVGLEQAFQADWRMRDYVPKVEGSLEPLGSSTVKLIENDEKRKRSPLLKRSHSEEAKSSQQSYQRQRKRCTEQIREVELQCEVAHTSALLNTPDGGSVASLAEKTTGHGKKLSLRRKGNFTQRN